MSERRRRPWHSLRVRAAVIFVILALVPALLVAVLLVDVNESAVETSERQLQAAVLSEVTGAIESEIRSARDELTVVGNAILLEAEKASPDPSFVAVHAALSGGHQVRAVRFEVPGAQVDTELRVQDDRTALPHPDDAARARARQQGGGATRLADGRLLLVVGLSLGAGTAEGYLSTPMDFTALRSELDAMLQTRFGGSHARLLVVDNERFPILSSGLDEGSLSAAPSEVWTLLPRPDAWSRRFAVIGPHRDGGTDMLGAVETIPWLGWGVALWRPQAEGYAVVREMKFRAGMVAALSVVLGLLLGLVTARRLTSPLLAMADKARAIGMRAWTELQPLPVLESELGDLSRSLDSMAEQLQNSEREIEHQAQLRNELGRFLNHQLVERIISGQHSLALGGERATVSILFADVVGFTPLAEAAPPEVVVSLLNELFALLTEVVLRNGGIVDKFLGDSVMAIFGAPEPTELHAHQALRAAEEMLRFVRSSNADWQQRFGVRIRLGIGVSSGDCTLGNLGSDKRMDYTAIGDAVNVAARLETLAAADQILLTESTRLAAGEEFDYVPLGEQNIAGRKAPVSVFALGGV